jgi:hypothetical protein
LPGDIDHKAAKMLVICLPVLEPIYKLIFNTPMPGYILTGHFYLNKWAILSVEPTIGKE